MMTPNPLPTDNTDLIRRTLTGSRLAAQTLIERHRDMVTRTALTALQNSDDAQDVAQEALMYALQHLTDLRDLDGFAAWLRQITLSRCVDYRRRRGTRRLGEPMTVLNEASEEARHAETLTIRSALSRLSGAQREVVLLHYAGGWSREEIAALLSVPLNTVRSRLMAARRHLRADLALFDAPNTQNTHRKHMTQSVFTLSATHTSLIEAALPGARILEVRADLEPWQPFGPRVRLALPDGSDKTVDFRGDLSPERAMLLPVLDRLGIPGPRILAGPVPVENASQKPTYLTLCEQTRGENLTLWALGGTPHRIRLAMERAFEGIDRLQGATEGLLSDPVGAQLPHRTLQDEIEVLKDDTRWNADWWLAEAGASRHEWLRDGWFQAALARTEAACADIRAPLVYTDYMHFFPQGYRIAPGDLRAEEPLGWPGDPHLDDNPLVEFTYLWGHFGDPLLGLAMVWVYDCYPFVHTGMVESFLWQRGASRREFAPRLALKALQMIARDLPLTRPLEGENYWDSLRGWAEQALAWM